MLYIFITIALYKDEQRNILLNKIKRVSNYNLPGEVERKRFWGKINQWIKKNNLYFNPKELFIILLIISTFPMLAGLLFKLHLFLCIMFSGISIFVFFLLVKFKKNRENTKKEEQMEQFLMSLTANLYSNPNIISCINKSINDIDNPLKKEFELLIDQNRRGILLNKCLKNMIDRNSSHIIEIILLGFIAANEKGVNLINYLDTQIEYIREKKSIRNYINILSSGPKYTSYLIMAIPVVSILIAGLINENFIKIIFSDLGLAVIVYAISSYIIGAILINKIVNFNSESRF